MPMRLKRAVPGRLVHGRFVPNPAKEKVSTPRGTFKIRYKEKLGWVLTTPEGLKHTFYTREQAVGWAKQHGAKNPKMPKLGSGKRFERCVEQEIAKGTAISPRAVCAARGIRKYGKKKMLKMARAGKKRHSHNPKIKVVNRGAHWFMEWKSAGGSGTSRHDSKSEAQRAAREYRKIHKRGYL